MTPQIDFYILTEPKLSQDVHFITRLIDKAYRKGNALKIHAEPLLLKQLDQALWQYFDFIPHQLNKSTNTIIVSKLFDKKPFILISLNADLTKEPENWHRIIHIIANSDQQKLAAREAYRYYQQSGFNIKTHKIKALTDGQQVPTGSD